MEKKIRFSEIEVEVPAKPGIYEIHTDTGIPLKVGIGGNLRVRLLQHRASRDSCLRLKPGGMRCNPDDVVSKGSILAKHLYYDQSITADYNLQVQADRRRYLINNCFIVFSLTETKEAARALEKVLENSGSFRYVYRATIR
jgi:hypothetical protein